jgi:hypothetical protein
MRPNKRLTTTVSDLQITLLGACIGAALAYVELWALCLYMVR